jgi:hypothetical protein
MEGTCLMAAAVPVAMVSGNARLSAAAKSLRTRNFFSKGDSVLHWTFPSGETAAGEGFSLKPSAYSAIQLRSGLSGSICSLTITATIS